MVFGTENTLAVGERGKGSGDVCWLLEGKNGMGGGGEGFGGANRESAARRDRAVTVLSSSSRRPNSASRSSRFASNSSSSSQLSSCRRGVDSLGFRGELFRVSTSKSSSQFSVCSAVVLVGWWLVSGVSGKSQSSIVLLAMENVRPAVVADARRWVSLEGRVRGCLV